MVRISIMSASQGQKQDDSLGQGMDQSRSLSPSIMVLTVMVSLRDRAEVKVTIG